jgi:hypothetical protein
MGGSPGGTEWPGPIATTFDVNPYFTADQLTQNHDTYMAALDAAAADSTMPLSAVVSAFGIVVPDTMNTYLDAWPPDAAQAVLTVIRKALDHGRWLIFGWQNTPEPVSVIAPDSWPGDQPVPVIVCGPHP